MMESEARKMLAMCRKKNLQMRSIDPKVGIFILLGLAIQWECIFSPAKLYSNEPSAVKEEQITPDYRKYRYAQKIVLDPPLPTLTNVYVDDFIDERVVSSYLAYRAWDMNHDGAIDFVEVLDQEGFLKLRAYDLDFDGLVDQVLK